MRSRTLPHVALLLSTLAACRAEDIAVPTARDARLVPPTDGALAVQSGASVILASAGVYAESSYLACLYAYYREGMPMSQIQSLCTTQLSAQEAVGFGEGGSAFEMPSRAKEGFDAAAIASSCGLPDGTVAAGPTGGSARHTEMHLQLTLDDKGISGSLVPIDYGSYSWGRKGELASDGTTYKGLTKAESEGIKQQWVEGAERILDELEAARAELAEDQFNLKKRQRVEELEAYYEVAKAAASKDPNKSKGAEGSTCATVMQAAREVLAECHRTGWRDMTCQVLQAKMNNCPDPTRIYVDPDAGYSCMPVVDPALVIAAWVRKCEEITTSGPKGGTPCSKPQPSGSGRTMSASETNLCRNTVAHTDGENDGCIVTLEVDTFGDTDVNGLIVWGLGVFGGPLVVLPPPPPPGVPHG